MALRRQGVVSTHALKTDWVQMLDRVVTGSITDDLYGEDRGYAFVLDK